jgi:hypothetical protein
MVWASAAYGGVLCFIAVANTLHTEGGRAVGFMSAVGESSTRFE